MTDKEKKILEALDTAASDVKIPESLEPDKMKEKLEGVKQKVWKRYPKLPESFFPYPSS